MKNTALETTYFDFYGDKLIAVQDNATKNVIQRVRIELCEIPLVIVCLLKLLYIFFQFS